MDESLRSTGPSSTGNAAVRRLRRILVGTQFAIVTPLLISAGLLLASLNELGRVELGFDTRVRYLVLRTGLDPETVLPAVRQVVRELDPSLPFSNVATVDELVARSLHRPRSLSTLVGGFAIVALILSIVGIYGVMAYYVQQHAKDIGIRLAVGGTPGDVLRLVAGQGMKVVASGLVVGC